MLYENKTELVDGTIGKIILYLRTNGTIVLNGKFVEHERAAGGAMEELCEFDEDAMYKLVRLHRHIEHEDAEILGGAQALFSNGVLYVAGKSMQFGVIHPELVQLCLGTSVRVECHPEIQAALGMHGMKTVKKYLAFKAEQAKKQ